MKSIGVGVCIWGVRRLHSGLGMSIAGVKICFEREHYSCSLICIGLQSHGFHTMLVITSVR